MAKASELKERMRLTALSDRPTVAVAEPVGEPGAAAGEPVAQAAPLLESVGGLGDQDSVGQAGAGQAAPAVKPETGAGAGARSDGGVGTKKGKQPSGRSSGKPRLRSRYTIDLEARQRRALKLFALDLDADASEVVRSLLSMLQDSAEVRAEVTKRVEAGRSTAVLQ